LKIEETYEHGHLFNIVTEYFEGIALKDFLSQEHKKDRKFLKEEVIWKIFIQLSLAIFRIHSKNIIHRSIKPATIYLDNKFNLKLTHFKNAYSLKSENDLCKEEIGTKNYMSPEMWLKQGYNTKSDIWALGVVLYEMCTFNKPFTDETEEGLFQKVTSGKYPPVGNKYSKELTGLIDEMLKIKPEERISIKDIIHKYVFISRSKETNLFDYVDKAINPQKKRVLSSRPEKRFDRKFKRPETAFKERKIKKSVNVHRSNVFNNKANEKKKEKDDKKEDEKKSDEVEELTHQYFDVKKSVADLIGEEKSNNLFEELNDSNIDEVVIKNSNEDINTEKSQKLKNYLNDYVQIMTKVCEIKNKK
jgi:serine/threonine protein kinase